jgi:hypothetical protein
LEKQISFQHIKDKDRKPIKSKLRVFERKVLRRIYGPTKESDGTWRIKSNDKLNELVTKTL